MTTIISQLESLTSLTTFGTYNYEHHEILEDSTNQAMYLFHYYGLPQLIDTAMKYQNLPSIQKVLNKHPDALIGWKVEHSSRDHHATGDRIGEFRNIEMNNDGVGKVVFNRKSMRDGIALLKANISPTRIFRILLHNYCGKKAYLEFQRLVEKVFGVDMPIGICNISSAQLLDLITCNTPSEGHPDNVEVLAARVNWVQNEYHPFLDSQVPDVCRKYGIRFEAHTVMTNVDGYAEVFSTLGVSESAVSTEKAAMLALKYAQKQGGVCFATTNFAHLRHNLKTLTNSKLDDEDLKLLSLLSQFSSLKRIIRYKGAECDVNADRIKAGDPAMIRAEILPKLKQDIATFEAGKIPSDLCIKIPKSYRPGGKMHGIIAEMLFGENLDDQMIELRAKLERKEKYQKCLPDAGNLKNGDSKVPDFTNEDLKTRLEAKWNSTLHLLLTKMRDCICKAREEKRKNAKRAQKPVQAVEQPDALPMDDYPDVEEFVDFINFLETGGEIDEDFKQDNEKDLPANIRFRYGTMNSDGRLDMCKQGFRNAFIETCDAVIKDGEDVPVNIRFKYGTLNSDGRLDMCKQGFRNAFTKTCEAVIRDAQKGGRKRKAPLIKHYLIGNNRIGEDGGVPGEGDRRVDALARMIRNRPDITTWFLAGNSLDGLQIRHVTEALEQTEAKYVWFKMNPIKTGAYHFGKMLVKTPSIELLDLFNCGLCNEGVEALARGLSDGASERNNPSNGRSNLKHLYLSINAISSANDFASMLSFLPLLESLFLSLNPIGDQGMIQLADVIQKAPCRRVLRRLNIDSLGLTDASLAVIEEIVKACPGLVSLELGSYKSTNYFDQKHNRFNVINPSTRENIERIARLLVHNAEIVAQKNKMKPSIPMHYLGLQHALVVKDGSGVRKTPDSRTTVQDAKQIIDEFAKNQLFHGTGINVNAIVNLYLNADGTFNHTGEWEPTDALPIGLAKTCGVAGNDASCPSRLVCGGLFNVEGVTRDDLRAKVRHPWPAVDHIKSIYRNTMKK